MSRIFISYRRDDSADTTGRIYDRLVAAFGRQSVFKDVDSIPAAVDFPEYIAGVMQQCQIQVVVIGPAWLNVADANGQRRLDDPEDFVRVEIEAALQRGIPILPLLVKGAAAPPQASLPPSLARLARFNALPVRYDPDFDNDMRRVSATIERYLAESAAAPISGQIPSSPRPGTAPAQPVPGGAPAAGPVGTRPPSALPRPPVLPPSTARTTPQPGVNRLATILGSVSVVLLVAVISALFIISRSNSGGSTNTPIVRGNSTIKICTECNHSRRTTELHESWIFQVRRHIDAHCDQHSVISPA